MLSKSCRGWKKYKTYDLYHPSISKDNNAFNEKVQENQLITAFHIRLHPNEIRCAVPCRLLCDCKRKISGRMIVIGRSKCNFLVNRCLAVAVLVILAAACSAYAQTEKESFSNSFNGSVSPEIVLLSEKNGSSPISAEDKVKESMDLFQMKVQSKQGKRSSSLPKESVSGDFAKVQSVSVYRNTLLNIESMLHRQLREKAKVDSLESIKMHILMRLNLKKLPNITKPISVPQNIIDNFYKGYNASSKNTAWSRMESTDESHLLQKSTVPENVKSNDTYGGDILTDSLDESSSSQMQGDDANIVNEFQLTQGIGLNKYQHTKTNIPVNNGEEHESILSHISSIYIFPELQPHVRHNRNADVFRFKIDGSYSDLSYATLHLYLRGWEWIGTHQPELYREINNQPSKDIVVTIHRAMKRANATSFTQKGKIFEFRRSIPSGLGQWVNVDLKALFGDLESNTTQEILIKGAESWMKPLVVTTDNTSKNPLTFHIEVGSQKKNRRKRNVYMDCTENDHDMRCCRYPLKVNFTSFGWHFVVAPTSFDAYFCSGDCKVGYLEQYTHTHLAALTTSATPCCSPTKMSSLSLLYFDDNHNLVLSVIPNMSVEGCSCS
ncbi:growth/differentiation factor 8 isoform X2 [Drosophila biarmipes]|uniref:growth/differentiation factor 8 isoform X2 n=1 Tax=Drosophila biarmipes TaxID=125945 RepID=UPI0007E5EDAD|nr:growth/differentiation factor 8 isoform X2 [Drosophila biarmipes]